MSRELLQQVLDALQIAYDCSETTEQARTAKDAITALRAALAQPEPVAWLAK